MLPTYYMLDGALHTLPEPADEDDVVELPAGAVVVPPRPVDAQQRPLPGYVLKGGTWELDPVIKVDEETSPVHLGEVHLLKIMEAVMVRFGGIQLTGGLLATEAPLRGLTLNQMANRVLLKAKPLLDAEIARMTVKAPVGQD